MKTIAVLRLSALGDVVMTVPLIHALQRTFPQTKIYWIISRPFNELVQEFPGVEFILVDKPRTIHDYYKLYQQFKSFQFDVLLMPQANMRANLISLMINAKRKIGYDTLHARDGQKWFVHETAPALREHLVDSFLQFAKYLGADLGANTENLNWQLPISQNDFTWAQDVLREAQGIKLAVCLAASKSERNWPLDRYADLLNQLSERWEITPVLIGGPSAIEIALGKKLISKLNGPVINLVGQSSFKQLAAVLKECDVLLAPDSGPVHIAHAMGTKVVGLYAVAPPEKTGPYLAMEWSVNCFPDAVKTILTKNPDAVSWRERVHDPRAMEIITVEAVREKMENLFHDLKLSLSSRA